MSMVLAGTLYGAVYGPGWEVYGAVYGPGWEVYGAVYGPGRCMGLSCLWSWLGGVWGLSMVLTGRCVGLSMVLAGRYGAVYGPGRCMGLSMVLAGRCMGLSMVLAGSQTPSHRVRVNILLIETYFV